MKKMIFILLFITLTCSVCETFELRSAKSFHYFKNVDMGLQWNLTSSSLDSLHIYCFMITDQDKVSVLLEYDKGLEIPHDGPFKGRVRLDKDVLREGKLRFHVSSVRIEDSGYWSCEVNKSEGFKLSPAYINVTEPQTAPETTTELQTTPEPTTEPHTTPETRAKTGPEPVERSTERGVWIGLIVGLSALVLCVCGLISIYFYKRKHNSRADTRGNNADGNTNAAGHEDICLNQVDGTRQI